MQAEQIRPSRKPTEAPPPSPPPGLLPTAPPRHLNSPRMRELSKYSNLYLVRHWVFTTFAAVGSASSNVKRLRGITLDCRTLTQQAPYSFKRINLLLIPRNCKKLIYHPLLAIVAPVARRPRWRHTSWTLSLFLVQRNRQLHHTREQADESSRPSIYGRELFVLFFV